MKIKILRVDSIARHKGLHRGQIREVIGVEDPPACNPDRGPLAFAVGKGGQVEGFYPDQYRVKVKPTPGEFVPAGDHIGKFDAEDDDFSFVDPFTPAG